MVQTVSRSDISRERKMVIYERVYLSHLSGSWSLRVLRRFHKLDCKELNNCSSIHFYESPEDLQLLRNQITAVN